MNTPTLTMVATVSIAPADPSVDSYHWFKSSDIDPTPVLLYWATKHRAWFTFAEPGTVTPKGSLYIGSVTSPTTDEQMYHDVRNQWLRHNVTTYTTLMRYIKGKYGHALEARTQLLDDILQYWAARQDVTAYEIYEISNGG
jgi:hypothetical protein